MEEAIGQHVKTNGKPKGISHATRMPIIVEPTPVPQIHSGVKRKYPTDTNETVLEDAKDGVDPYAQNDTHETVTEDVKDGVAARAPNEDRNGKSQDIRHGQNHEMRSGYSSNRMNNLGNPNGIRYDNDYIDGI